MDMKKTAINILVVVIGVIVGMWVYEKYFPKA